ncbi:serine hydrolase [Flavitalea sp.]|nr:serine hydrolase [Flavitalea sp.]
MKKSSFLLMFLIFCLIILTGSIDLNAQSKTLAKEGIQTQAKSNTQVKPNIQSTANTKSTSNNQSRAALLNAYFSKLAENGQFNGNVLIAENGKIVYEKSFGYADLALKKLNVTSTSFPVASVTKTITSTAILQLEEKNKLKLSDEYSKYFPAFPYPDITIKQLLSHTSRIPSGDFYKFLDSLRKEKDTFFTNKDVVPALVKMNKSLQGEPAGEGTRSNFAYSNVNYYLLALLIEHISGMPFNSYLRKYIFLPAGMENSSLSEFYFGIDKNLCKEQRYRYLFSELPESIDTTSDNAYIFRTYNFKGHGDVVSTTHDLLKYSQALDSGILLKKLTLSNAYQPIVPPANPNTSGYGLGWSLLYDTTYGNVVFHHGGGLGIEVMFVRNLSRHQTIILFDNMKFYAFDKALSAMKILNSEKISIPKLSTAKKYGHELMTGGMTGGRKVLERLKADTTNYNTDENEMNLLGYQFLWNNLNDQAFEVLKTNVELFPASWNSYDSYGEILLKLGKKNEAAKNYQRSIELNPKNDAGKKILEQIKAGN